MFQELVLDLLERHPVSDHDGPLRLDFPRQLRDGAVEIRIVPREREGGAVLGEGGTLVAAPMVNFGQAPDGGQVFRRALEDGLELGLRLGQAVELDQGTAKGDTR